jgi:hypothetical protein
VARPCCGEGMHAITPTAITPGAEMQPSTLALSRGRRGRVDGTDGSVTKPVDVNGEGRSSFGLPPMCEGAATTCTIIGIRSQGPVML